MQHVWRRGSVALAFDNGKERVIKAWLREGLAVHERTGADGNVVKRTWQISHAQSGLMLWPGYFRRKGEALERAEELLCFEGLWEQRLQDFGPALEGRQDIVQRIRSVLGVKSERKWQMSSEARKRAKVLAKAGR
jgi:hypothetical protein